MMAYLIAGVAAGHTSGVAVMPSAVHFAIPPEINHVRQQLTALVADETVRMPKLKEENS